MLIGKLLSNRNDGKYTICVCWSMSAFDLLVWKRDENTWCDGPYVPDTFRRKGEFSRMDRRMGNTRSMGCDIGSMAWNFWTGQISCVNGKEGRKEIIRKVKGLRVQCRRICCVALTSDSKDCSRFQID